MCCKIVELKNKEIICIKDGTKLGCVSDVEIDTCTGKIVSLIIYKQSKMLGLFGKDEDVVIPWDSVEVIGEDTILVSSDSKDLIQRNSIGQFD